jgi:hypothetical protein
VRFAAVRFILIYILNLPCILFTDCVNVSLDNSEWMRNGDYNPSRLEAQQDAGKF